MIYNFIDMEARRASNAASTPADTYIQLYI